MQLISEIVSATLILKQMGYNIQESVSLQAWNPYCLEIQNIVTSTNLIALQVNQSLKDLRNQTILHSMYNGSGDELNFTVYLMKRNLTDSLVRKFVSIITEYQLKQMNIKNVLTKRACHDLMIMRPDITVIEALVMLSSGCDPPVLRLTFMPLFSVSNFVYLLLG